MNIVVWSDIACPFCYIAGTRVRRALKALHAEDLFTIERKSYELSPQITVSEPCLSFYAKKMDVTEEDIAPGLRKIEREAAKDGLVFHYDRAIAANTFNAHRLVKYAAAHGVPPAGKGFPPVFWTRNSTPRRSAGTRKRRRNSAYALCRTSSLTESSRTKGPSRRTT